jgi:hypothetical protein
MLHEPPRLPISIREHKRFAQGPDFPDMLYASRDGTIPSRKAVLCQRSWVPTRWWDSMTIDRTAGTSMTRQAIELSRIPTTL